MSKSGSLATCSLEDCDTNFFALTDVCGIKWTVFREEVAPSSLDPAGDDAVLSSFIRGLEAELLVVWRKVPKAAFSSPFGYGLDDMPKANTQNIDSKNLLGLRKELWVFWYGDRPQEQFKRVVSAQLKEVEECSGTWDSGLPYEARTLLYKALNNLIERSLVRKDFVRLGKWFVQPFDGPDRTLQKSTHLSFSFQYFIHGESSVCASVDVRQHPAVRRLSLYHLSVARGQSTPVQVILAPYGLAATLTGTTFKSSDPNTAKLLKEWNIYYPIENSKYYCQDIHGDVVAMPQAVEVVIAGVRLVYPTCFVLVSDLDAPHVAFGHASAAALKTMHTSKISGASHSFQIDGLSEEPTAFTASNHHLLSECDQFGGEAPFAQQRLEHVMQDALCVNQDTLAAAAATGDGTDGGNSVLEYLSHWDFCNPSRLARQRRTKNRQTSKEKSSKDRNRFSSKVPFHRKMDVVDELAWSLDHSDMLCSHHGPGSSSRLAGLGGNGVGGSVPPGSMGPPGSVKGGASVLNEGVLSLASPASVGPVTPCSVTTPKASAPGSVRTPGEPSVHSALMSPKSNGPLTPMDMDQAMHKTPKSVPSLYSPFTNVKSVERKPDVSRQDEGMGNVNGSCGTSYGALKQEDESNSDHFPVSNGDLETIVNNHIPVVVAPFQLKRPALPLKEYEDDLSRDEFVADTFYDYETMHHWLNVPVKRFRPAENRGNDPLRPLYRRCSQADIFGSNSGPVQDQDDVIQQAEPEVNGDPEDVKNVNSVLFADPYEFKDGQDPKKDAANQKRNDDDLFTAGGLKATISDLDNLFDDSSNEGDDGAGSAPTPPDSNKPATNHDLENEDKISTKLSSRLLPASAIKSEAASLQHHDQLAKMFPTPPSHEHIQTTSPAEVIMDMDHYIKGEPLTPNPELMDWTQGDDANILSGMSHFFSPLQKLYSDEFPPINLPPELHYRPRLGQFKSINGNQPSTSSPNSVPTPLGTPGGGNVSKPGMSPISPLTSVEGPRSHHGPNSVGAYSVSHDVASPASASSSYVNKTAGSDPVPAASHLAEVNSLVLNLALSDTLLNVFRDRNFDSCTLCVCNNEGNIRGRDAAIFLPDLAGDEEINCSCGYSAVVNRRLAHQSGLFYEDETEVTGITEDLYFRKKPSLLLLDPKYSDSDQGMAEKASHVDTIPQNLLELIHQQSTYVPSYQNAIVKYSKLYLRNSHQSSASTISMVDLMDGNEVVFSALEQVKSAQDSAANAVAKLDETQKASCIHKWTLLQSPGPQCSEDVVRVMKVLQPTLNESLHAKKQPSNLSVSGPLTWRQFHHMAGPATKGNTDDQCEPLPVPAILVGHEKEFISLSPLALHFWETLSLEPYSQPRDVSYIVVAPDNEFLIESVKTFFKSLSGTYETCRLGKHVPNVKKLRDGILRVGKNMTKNLVKEECERWFDLIGDFPAASLLKLYSKVCRHYLPSVFAGVNIDRSLLDGASQKQVLTEKPPQSPMTSNFSNMDGGGSSSFGSGAGKFLDNAEDINGKENIGLGADVGISCADVEGDGNVPAVVIYIVDPFSFGVDNCDMLRLFNLGLLRSFAQVLPTLSELLRQNIYLQLVPLESIFEQCQAADPSLLRGLAFSVYSQTQRPLTHKVDYKTLTGFGPASTVERFLKSNETKAKQLHYLYQPPYVLAPPPPPAKKKSSSDADSMSSAVEKSSVLFVSYCLSEDQRWLLASASDDRGELVKTCVINIEIPNKTRRKKASARRVGLRKLMDWVLGVMAVSLVPWRLVIGRIGRIGHGELRGWSVLLGRKALKKASKQLREICSWTSDVPHILSACLVSMEPDSSLRVMADQFSPDERFGQKASSAQLSAPRDVTCTHILVFPTSATAQSGQKPFEESMDGDPTANDIFGGMDLIDDNGDNGLIGDISELKDIFSGDDWGQGVDQPGSPGSPSGKRNSMSQPNSPSQGQARTGADQFRYGQEERGERIEMSQQPLALGYLVSTAKTGPMPRSFWAACPHLENVCPVFLKSALHINQPSVQLGGDEGFANSSSSSGRVHSLDSTYTTDVLRYVLEGYNALSWLSLDPQTHDRRSCLPVHVQILQQMYINLAALV